ncbi:MAG: hypothetical protein IPO07_16115 [Haliscomenobacter sp.]|nr:hypothetical protein [Haliscomenobacter sp.]
MYIQGSCKVGEVVKLGGDINRFGAYLCRLGVVPLGRQLFCLGKILVELRFFVGKIIA